MQTKISKIANIISGYTFRGPVGNQQNGDIYVLQAKNISINNDVINLDELSKINSGYIRNPYFLNYDDVLIVSRGSGIGSFRSSVFNLKNNSIIASSSIHIIRISAKNVISKYISLYLNSSDGQRAINKIVTGHSYIQSILVRNLAELEIPIPSISQQKLVISMSENLQRQEKLLNKKLNIQKNILDSIFTNLTNK